VVEGQGQAAVAGVEDGGPAGVVGALRLSGGPGQEDRRDGVKARVPGGIGRLSQAMLGHPRASRLARVDAPVSLDRLDWVRRAEELCLPVLLIHSDDDEFVPSGPSRRLAQARPDLVTYVSSRGARHTKEWNVDPEGWDTAVARFLLAL
jgi:pimeloyl-ACP methyl ester carboxylesterase